MTKVLMEHALKVILNGIADGDDNGGPTRVSKLLSDSLFQLGEFDPNDIAARYLNWWQSDAFDTGPVFAIVFSRVSEGMKQNKAVEKADDLLGGQTAGCNPAHRISPLVAFPFIKTLDIPSIARQEARLTHHHPAAGDAASVVALLCRLMIEGNTWEASKELAESLDPTGWQTVILGRISKDGYAPNVVKTALHFLEKDCPLESSKEFSGASNYAPVIVGTLAAVREAFSRD